MVLSRAQLDQSMKSSCVLQTAAFENYKVLKSEAAKGGEAVLNIAAQATASSVASHKNITGRDGNKMVARVKTGPASSGGADPRGQETSLDGSEDPDLKKELDAEIAKLRGLLVSARSTYMRLTRCLVGLS
jgi:hypothetical protein